MVNSNISGCCLKPGEIMMAIWGAKTMANRVRVHKINIRYVNVDLANKKASFFPSFRYMFLKRGTNAMVSEPSAKRRRIRFGILNATKKASAKGPVPRVYATTTSLRNPKILLKNVAPAITDVFFIMFDIGDLTKEN